MNEEAEFSYHKYIPSAIAATVFSAVVIFVIITLSLSMRTATSLGRTLIHPKVMIVKMTTKRKIVAAIADGIYL